MEEADHLCERIAIIDHGDIVALDTPEALKDRLEAMLITLQLENPDEHIKIV